MQTVQNSIFETQIFNLNPNPIIRVSKSGEINLANPAAKELLDFWNIEIGHFLPTEAIKIVSNSLLEEVSESEIVIYTHTKAITFKIIFSPEEEFIYLYAVNSKSLTEKDSSLNWLLNTPADNQIVNILLPDLFQEVPFPLYVKKNKGNFLFRNKEFNRIFGKESKDKTEILILQESNSIEDKFKEVEELKVSVEGNVFYYLHYTKLVHISGEMMIVGYFFDITDFKNIELNLLKEKKVVEDLVEAKDKFISIMSHEIRTPMNAVSGIINLIYGKVEDGELKEYLHALKTSSDNLIKFLNNVLDISKLESGRLLFEETDFDLEESFQNIQETFIANANSKNVKINISIDKEVPVSLKGDSLRLHQILLNLVSNALKFTKEGFIEIGVRKLDESNNFVHLLFSVKDTGIGIPKNKLGFIFESFTQAGTDTSRKYGGTGLGLAITKKLIELQGGKITVVSEPGEGATFSFDLALKKSNSRKIKFNVATPAVNFDLAGLKVLVVEDNSMNQMIVGKFLEVKQIKFDFANDGLEALNLIDKRNYDIVLMDLYMPQLDGYETTSRIRKMGGKYETIPIVAFTASDCLEIVEKAKIYGINGYLTKPFEPNELYAKIANLTRRNFEKEENSNQTSIVKNYKFINLAYLKEASNNNSDFVKEMINVFLRQTPTFLEGLDQAIKEKDWAAFRKVMHKFKPTLGMMGIRLENEVSTIENNAKNLVNLEEIPGLVNKIAEICKVAYEELNQELLTYK